MSLETFKEIVTSARFWLSSAFLAAVIRIIWFLISELIKWLKFKRSSKPCNFPEELNLSKKYKYLKEEVTFSCILVRFGTDDYLRSLASDQDKYEGRLQNKIIKLDIVPLKDKKQKDKDLGCKLLFSIPVHKRIGTQFKCFVEVNNEEDVNEIEDVLKECDILVDVDISKSPCLKRKRVYFLIKKLHIEKSVENIKNNYIFPE